MEGEYTALSPQNINNIPATVPRFRNTWFLWLGLFLRPCPRVKKSSNEIMLHDYPMVISSLGLSLCHIYGPFFAGKIFTVDLKFKRRQMTSCDREEERLTIWK